MNIAITIAQGSAKIYQRSRSPKKLSMDMGYNAEMGFFINKVQKFSNYSEISEHYVNSTLVTLKAAEALRTGETQTIKFPA